MNLIQKVKSLSDWKNVILKLRGPYPTMDSEIILTKIISDIIKVDDTMKRLEYLMVDLINCKNLLNVNINGDTWSSYDTEVTDDIEMMEF